MLRNTSASADQLNFKCCLAEKVHQIINKRNCTDTHFINYLPIPRYYESCRSDDINMLEIPNLLYNMDCYKMPVGGRKKQIKNQENVKLNQILSYVLVKTLAAEKSGSLNFH